MKQFPTLLTLVLLFTVPAQLATARKVSVKYKKEQKQNKKDESAGEEPEMVRGSFMVASQCPDCNNGYKLEQISFSGFDKPGRSTTESFFITNNTDRNMTGVTLYIEYLTPDGRQLHKRFLNLSCDIPAGETRKADIRSWDTQRSFHYDKSVAGKRTSPFTVRFDPVSYRLRF